MNLHVFNDDHGFLSDLTVRRIRGLDPSAHHIFINLSRSKVYKNEHLQYVSRNINAYKQYVRGLPGITTIIFYPLDYISAIFFREFREQQPEVRAVWFFWSYEFYHRPDRVDENLDRFSKRYTGAGRSILSVPRKLLVSLAKTMVAKPQFKRNVLNEAYRHITAFYAFLPSDYRNVFSSLPGNQIRYFPISLISIANITQGINAPAASLSREIMIGHAASPSINHFEILTRLSAFNPTHHILLPMNYGDSRYAELIRIETLKRFPLTQVEFLEERLSMHNYYKRLSLVGFAAFNFRWQEALGNILFLIWNGAKVFLRADSSVYQQFRNWDVKVYTLDQFNEDFLNDLLSPEDRQKNRGIVEELFAESRISEYWKRLVFNPTGI